MSVTVEEMSTIADSILKLDEGQRNLRRRLQELELKAARFDGIELRLARFESGLGALELRLQRLVRRLERIEARLDDAPIAGAPPRRLSDDPWPS